MLISSIFWTYEKTMGRFVSLVDLVPFEISVYTKIEPLPGGESSPRSVLWAVDTRFVHETCSRKWHVVFILS